MVRNFFGGRNLWAVLAVSALVTGACSSSEDARNPSGSPGENVEVGNPLADEVNSFITRYPPVIRGKFGTSDTSAYLRIRTPRLADAPYYGKGGRFRSLAPGVVHPTELSALSRVVVRGRVVAIGLPHFNSADGSFWDPALHEEAGVVDVAKTILRDVLIRVDEVWGSRLPEIVPGSFVAFVARGGQIAVNLPKKVAVQLRFEAGGIQAFSEAPLVDVAVGEEAVFFLDLRPIFGLYRGKYAARFELAPALESTFKYTFHDPKTIGPPGQSDFKISLSSVQSIVSQQLARKSDYLDAEVGVTYPLGPHPPGQSNRAPIVGLSP